jgi:hypothetical protein
MTNNGRSKKLLCYMVSVTMSMLPNSLGQSHKMSVLCNFGDLFINLLVFLGVVVASN